MGMRVRLKASVDISKFPPPAQVILTALKRYGMMVADNGGDWFLSGAPDPRWNDEQIATLKRESKVTRGASRGSIARCSLSD